jgi:GDP-L-fucose synthase
MTGYEVVFVCSAYKFSASAAREVSTKLYKNIQMSINILEAARRTGVKKIILLSSVTAYQKIEGEISEMQYFSDDTMQNVSVYGLSKRLTEFLSRIYEKETNFKTVVVRPSAVYGPYDDFNLKTSYVMSALIRKVIDGHNPIEVWGTGNERRNFIYVGDLAEAMVTAMEKIDGIESFNIASSTSISIKELIYKIVDICGSNDVEILFNTSCPSSNAIHNVSIEKAKNMLGFVPETSIEEGIKKTAEWYISNKELFK